jgi:two-component system, OmpR family, sensor kinase
MSATGAGGRVVARFRPKPLEQWTLRSRLVVAIVLLAGVALLVVNFAAAAMIRGYLTDRMDTELQRPGRTGRPPISPSTALSPGTAPVTGTGGDQDFPSKDDQERFKARFPFADEDFGIVGYTATGERDRSLGTVTGTQLPLINDFAAVKSHVNAAPFTADGTKNDYRVLVSQGKDEKGATVYLLTARSLERIDQTSNQVMLVGLSVSGLVLIGLALGAGAVVRIGLRPLTRMERAAASIAADKPPTGKVPPLLVAGRVPDADPHTEAGRLGLALNTMLARIQAALAARSASEQRLRQFLADASHELRTPLTSIRGFAELYRRSGSQGGPEMTEMMSRIEQEAARMGLLVEDLLLLAALDEERPLRAQPVDLLAVAADTISDAHVRNSTRFVALASFEPVTVVGDDHRLRQVATNLISNAVRHTGEFAKIDVRVAEETMGVPDPRVVAAVGADLSPGTPIAVFEVADSGPGVPAEHAERIFERLYRADPGRSRSQGGSGLGLSIVAAIVAAHGGRVELVSAPGRGATFRVLLPLRT